VLVIADAVSAMLPLFTQRLVIGVIGAFRNAFNAFSARTSMALTSS
jgi:hypothetical protein